MSGRFAVKRHDAPLVRKQSYMPIAHGYHRLNSKTHAFLKQDTVTPASIIGHKRVFVHLTAYTVTSQFTYNTIPVTLAMRLNCITYVSKVISSHSLFYTFIQSFLCNTQKFLHFRKDLTDAKRIATVAVISCKKRAAINRYDISVT